MLGYGPGVRLGAFLLLSAVLLACSAGTIYRDSWQPLSAGGARGYKRLVGSALLLEGPDDVEAVKAVGGELIGWHAARKGWAVRAGSTGGTHFFPVDATAERTRAVCTTWGALTTCSARSESRWSRVAVVRVRPDLWHRLPPHLVPPVDQIEKGVAVTAYRTECDVNGSTGRSVCGSDWRIKLTGR